MNLPLFLFGNRRIRANAEAVPALLNLCLEAGLNLTGFQNEPDGGISFRCTLFSSRKLLRRCRKEKIPVTWESGGVPVWLRRHRARGGLILGALCAVVLLFLSTRFVWSVQISGNRMLTSGEIRRALSEEGLEVGSYLPGLNVNAIETRVLTASDTLAWLSIRFDGTVAVVQVVERVTEPEKKTAPANLIAARDGQIELLELYRGKPMVKIGQPVRAGELLVSGVYDSNTVGFRYTRAAGKVLARTERNFSVEIPLSYEKKEYLSEKRGGFVLHFFKFSLNFLKSTGNDLSMCDIIEKETSPDQIGLYDLPVSLSYRTLRRFAVIPAKRTPEEALDLAWEELDRQLEALSRDVQLLRKETTATVTERAVILHCTVTCVEDIALQTEFEIAEP